MESKVQETQRQEQQATKRSAFKPPQNVQSLKLQLVGKDFTKIESARSKKGQKKQSTPISKPKVLSPTNSSQVKNSGVPVNQMDS